jgi:cytochrome c oxidase subunit 2
LFVTSSDVIHSFWVPRLAGKRDAIPNHVNRIITRPTSEQSMIIRGQCAEFCGKTHAMMGFHVVVQSQAEFDEWVEQQQADAPVPAGVIQPAPEAQAGANEVALAGLSDQVAQEQPTTESTDTAPESEVSEDDTMLQATAEGVDERAAPAQATAEAESDNDLSTPEARGYELFATKGCIGCHAIKGYPGAVNRVAPDLTRVGSRQYIVAGWLENNEENMEAWLRNPDAVKPENLMAAVIKRGTLTEQEIDDLRAYLQSLK